MVPPPSYLARRTSTGIPGPGRGSLAPLLVGGVGFSGLWPGWPLQCNAAHYIRCRYMVAMEHDHEIRASSRSVGLGRRWMLSSSVNLPPAMGRIRQAVESEWNAAGSVSSSADLNHGQSMEYICQDAQHLCLTRIECSDLARRS